MTDENNLPYVVLQGTPRERGRIHGETLRTRILEFIAGWKDRLFKETGIPAEKYLDKFLEDTDYYSAIEKWTPDLMEEIMGVSEGASLPFKIAFAHQLADEEWGYRVRMISPNADYSGKACSSIGIPLQDKYPTLLGQTLDLPDYCSGYLALLEIRYPNSDLKVLVLTEVGVVGANGLNNKSIGVCANTLSQLGTSKTGLPVDCVVRGILAQPTLQEAENFVCGITHATGQNYILGSKEAVLDYECSSNKVVRYHPDVREVWHTNHPLSNTDQDEYLKWVESLSSEEQEKLEGELENSTTRFESVERRISANQDITVATLKETFCSHDSEKYPVCRHKRPWDDSITASASIMVLSNKPVLHLAPGLPCQTAYKEYGFD